MIGAVTQLVGQVRRHVRQQHVVVDVVRRDERETQQQRPPVPGEDLAEVTGGRGLHGLGGLTRLDLAALQLLEGGRLVQLEPQIETDEPERRRDQEGDAPAPRQHLVRTEHTVEDDDEAGGPDVAAERAQLQEAAEEAAPLVGRVLRDERRGTPVLPAGREALHQPEEDQQGRGPQADDVVRGDEADGEGTHRHHDHGEGEDALAADLVAQRPEDHAAERTHQEGHRERREGAEQLGRVVPGREEDLPDGHGQIAVDAEVVPLHRVAEGRGLRGALDRRIVGHGDVAAAQLRVAALLDRPEQHPVSSHSRGIHRLVIVGRRHYVVPFAGRFSQAPRLHSSRVLKRSSAPQTIFLSACGLWRVPVPWWGNVIPPGGRWGPGERSPGDSVGTGGCRVRAGSAPVACPVGHAGGRLHEPAGRLDRGGRPALRPAWPARLSRTGAVGGVRIRSRLRSRARHRGPSR